MERDEVTKFWCHLCKKQFVSSLQPGRDDIFCPTCGNDFCQVTSGSAKHFKPYQKSPHKTHQLAIEHRTQPITIHELHQVLQQQQHIKQGVEVTPEQLRPFRKRIHQTCECAVCRQDLKRGQVHLQFDCKHCFHQQCMVQWLRIKNSCPTCRGKMIK